MQNLRFIDSSFGETINLLEQGLEDSFKSISKTLEGSFNSFIKGGFDSAFSKITKSFEDIANNFASNLGASLGNNIASAAGFGSAQNTSGSLLGGLASLLGDAAGSLFSNSTQQVSTPVINMNVTAADANSFRSSQNQIVTDAALAMRRANRNT